MCCVSCKTFQRTPENAGPGLGRGAGNLPGGEARSHPRKAMTSPTCLCFFVIYQHAGVTILSRRLALDRLEN